MNVLKNGSALPTLRYPGGGAVGGANYGSYAVEFSMSKTAAFLHIHTYIHETVVSLKTKILTG